MKSRILKVLCTLILASAACWWGWITPVAAQTSARSNDTEIAAFKQKLEELQKKALEATNSGNFVTAEKYWTEMIEQLPENAALWSNRGNAKVSQNKLEEAIADYNKAIELAPEAPEPYLNRGIALEGLGQWQKAIADYNRVLELEPTDAAAFNNRGNAFAGLGEWEKAIADYRQATLLAPDLAFAHANYALALYQIGQIEQAIRTMKNLVRKYPRFADMRAALTAALWNQGKRGEAESNWVAVVGLDPRYKDINWVAKIRRWPPAMVAALDKFLHLMHSSYFLPVVATKFSLNFRKPLEKYAIINNCRDLTSLPGFSLEV
ncbi:MAG: tetratricopeptide repeat protein [Oscillatoriaceae bacterium SKW80]|nr:tetratricopeptide repeat protein [Oscillatoriaceae bacterium SKYG93]MCX8122029.1 tetratricopeptide repeat protein [Oscillatoriaceae bacterium SKW80]MDW8454316.1 tetratricopeptide repeat protein [Oscillatoriaceae cyanobacterium SKYGB_i_bin93]HIK29180.1 tetratricopeptide repeat protein [Oscillatoriaceae cyanobacterium M7585_C2015_266]